MPTRRVILHLDMDAFYANVEIRDKPSLRRGQPVVVGGVGGRGVVATASYTARAFGVRSAMPIGEARRLLPSNAAYLSPRFPAYKKTSSVVMDTLRELSPLVEPLSLDEAFVDVSHLFLDGWDEDSVRMLGERVRSSVRERTQLTCSVGIGTSKLIAKIASDLDKPDGLVVVAPGQEQQTLSPLSVRRLWGVGPATAQRLGTLGVETVQQLRELTESELVGVFGSSAGRGLFTMARAEDDRPVVADRAAKSVSAETTFDVDLRTSDAMERELSRLSERVAQRLQASGVAGRTVTVKIRHSDFSSFTRSETTVHPVSGGSDIARAALRLAAGVDVAAGIRLAGVGVSQLSDFAQGSLFDAVSDVDSSTVDGGLDHLDVDETDADASVESSAIRVTDSVTAAWQPGQDVEHPEWGAGWVWGSGRGWVTVRFEGPQTEPGPVRTFRVEDAMLRPSQPPDWRANPDRADS